MNLASYAQFILKRGLARLLTFLEYHFSQIKSEGSARAPSIFRASWSVKILSAEVNNIFFVLTSSFSCSKPILKLLGFLLFAFTTNWGLSYLFLRGKLALLVAHILFRKCESQLIWAWGKIETSAKNMPEKSESISNVGGMLPRWPASPPKMLSKNSALPIFWKVRGEVVGIYDSPFLKCKFAQFFFEYDMLWLVTLKV